MGYNVQDITIAADEVVLLSPEGEEIGRAPKCSVHGPETPYHLAFSCHVVDDEGRVLITRRALTKRTWPGVWTNSFCGHPRPGESVPDAVVRHARVELGIEIEALSLELPLFQYRAVDPSGTVEHELCPVYSARVVGELQPNPLEVMDTAWVHPSDLGTAIRAVPDVFSPWFVLQAGLLDLLSEARAA